MNEEDLRDCFAMFAMTGVLMNGNYLKTEVAELAYEMADMMLKARKHKEKDDEEVDVGIARVAPKRVYRRKS